MAALFLLSGTLPTWIVLHFTVERARIEREVCVMREAAPEMNDCHGSCYLMRQLRVAEEREQDPFQRIQLRQEPAVVQMAVQQAFSDAAEKGVSWAFIQIRLLPGDVGPLDPVPWVG